jgi:stress-induced-phosphoprotein 1
LQGFSRKGSALHYLGRYDEAVQAYTAGLQVDPENAQLKEGLQEVKAQMASEKGLPNPFGDPNVFVRLRNNPKTRAYLEDPEFVKLINDLRTNPSSLG